MPRLLRIAIASAAAAVSLAVAAPSFAAEAANTPIQMRLMTWVDIAAAIEGGATTVIVPTGGIEQNGPHMALGKHDLIVAAAAERIASSVSRTLVAPVVSFVPEGDFAPATGNMLFPGTIGVSEATFEAMLEDIARSLKHAGFKDIVFIGDHGMSQQGQAKVAQKLTHAWGWSGVRVHHLDKYYDDAGQIAALKTQGESDATIGQHASLIDTSELMSVSPASVDLKRLPPSAKDLPKVGGSGEPARASVTRGAALLKMRIEAAAAQLKALTARP